MGENGVLLRFAKPLMASLRDALDAGEEIIPGFGECLYGAHSWKKHKRRVIIKADTALHPGRKPKDNPRLIVTNLKITPKFIYRKVYCARGDIENRIKELKLGLEIDRTSCTSFNANQLRVLMTAAAYVLMQELRLHARRTGCARAQVNTLRLRLLKLGVWVESSVRRIARSVGAVPT